jgi:hypothetical protein
MTDFDAGNGYRTGAFPSLSDGRRAPVPTQRRPHGQTWHVGVLTEAPNAPSIIDSEPANIVRHRIVAARASAVVLEREGQHERAAQLRTMAEVLEVHLAGLRARTLSRERQRPARPRDGNDPPFA